MPLHRLEEYKYALTHLGRGMTKCTHLKSMLDKFFIASEKSFRNFETHIGFLQDDLNKIESIDDDNWSWLQKRVLRAIRLCVEDLDGIKKASEGLIKIDEQDEKVVLWEEKEILSLLEEIKGQERARIEAMVANIRELYGELKQLHEIATKDIMELVNPELEAFAKLAQEVEGFSESHTLSAYSGLREEVRRRKVDELQQLVTLFKYIVAGAENIGKEEVIELSEIKTINELTNELNLLRAKAAREVERVVETIQHDRTSRVA